MRNLSTLYIDESGKSSLIDNAEEPFILTGVLLDQEEKSPIEGFFNYIKRKYKINPNIPFHRRDLDRISEDRVRAFFKVEKGKVHKYLKKD
jgi:hypothetical protein